MYNVNTHFADPDAMAFKFGYTDHMLAYGVGAADYNVADSCGRGISFRAPVFM